MHTLKQLIQCPNRVTSTLIDFILGSFRPRFSQKRVLNVDLSDHQLIFVHEKFLNLKQTMFTSTLTSIHWKTIGLIIIKRALDNCVFQTTKFSSTSMQHIQISFRKLWQLLAKSPLKRLSEWKEIPRSGLMAKFLKLNTIDRHFQQFKKYRLNIDRELFHKAKCETSKLITTKKQAFLKERLMSQKIEKAEKIDKPKELWRSLKYLGMPNKSSNYKLKSRAR